MDTILIAQGDREILKMVMTNGTNDDNNCDDFVHWVSGVDISNILDIEAVRKFSPKR